MIGTNSATPSISAAKMMPAVWIRALFSGWRAMPSAAEPPIRPMPTPHRGRRGCRRGRHRSRQKALTSRRGDRGFLQQRDHVQHDILRRNSERSKSVASAGLRTESLGSTPSPRPAIGHSASGLLPPFGGIHTTILGHFRLMRSRFISAHLPICPSAHPTTPA